ncbi:hypothetical protein [Jannaschia aquimarina]|uniref:Uncharacterized protein n=1 Tax=Jannaschia aquimarina TaxID=935700 RepID=A0A0D1CP98_9RHOB|nr:hypothetical protein [Jannaschia aquimarina]KIT16592.1 hypothetical protein jaqu_16870 [Jannaschia aquimarina]SNT41410.1 hypothetical protein SAMN05421775_1176 [Jannaschia aquimarina]
MDDEVTNPTCPSSAQCVYRLEPIWDILEQYFRDDRPYRILAPIDEVENHSDIPALECGQSWCGLWVLGDIGDAADFEARESSNAVGA